MRKHFAALSFGLAFSALLTNCASHDGPPSAPTLSGDEDSGATRRNKSSRSSDGKDEGNPNVGLLTFFSSGDKGVVVNPIHWDQTVSSENPGADCELKLHGSGLYSCVMRQGKDAVVLSLKVAGPAAHLSKMTLDGKGQVTKDRWITELVQMGYVLQQEGKGKVAKSALQSPDGLTHVDAIWVQRQSAITLIFKALPQPTQPKKAD